MLRALFRQTCVPLLGLLALLAVARPAAGQECQVASVAMLVHPPAELGGDGQLLVGYDAEGEVLWKLGFSQLENVFGVYLDREASRVYMLREVNGGTISIFRCDGSALASVLPRLGPDGETWTIVRGEINLADECIDLWEASSGRVAAWRVSMADLRALEGPPPDRRIDSELVWERTFDGLDGPRQKFGTPDTVLESHDLISVWWSWGSSTEHIDFARADGVIRNLPFSASFGADPGDPSGHTVLATDWDGTELFRRTYDAHVALAQCSISDRDAIGMVVLDKLYDRDPPRILRLDLNGDVSAEETLMEGSEILQVVPAAPVPGSDETVPMYRGVVITRNSATGFGQIVGFATDYASWPPPTQIRYPVGPVLPSSPYVIPVAAIGGIGGVARFFFHTWFSGNSIRHSESHDLYAHPEATTPFRFSWLLPDGKGLRVRDAAGLHHTYLMLTSEPGMVFNNLVPNVGGGENVELTRGPTTHDVDHDGVVALPDVDLAARGWVGTATLDPAAMVRADADLDGQLSVADVLFIERVARGVDLDATATGSAPAIQLVESKAVAGGHQVTLELVPGGPEPVAYQLSLSADGVVVRDLVVSDQLPGTNWVRAVGDQARWLSVRISGGLIRATLEGDLNSSTVLRLEAGWSARDGKLHLLEPIGLNLDELVKIGDTPPAAPAARTALHGVRPNPFNPATTISYELAEPGSARLVVYDLRGQRVVVLVDGRLDAGRHEEVWDGRDAAGQRVASGAYWVRLETSERVYTRKMMLVK